MREELEIKKEDEGKTQEQISVTGKKDLLDSELNVINVGLEIFFNALKLQNIRVIDVSWTPPVKLDKETDDILDKIL